MNRRDFFKYMAAKAGQAVAAGSAATYLAGCRSTHDDMTINNSAAQAAYDACQKRMLNGQTVDDFCAKAATTFVNGPTLVKRPDFDYAMTERVLGKDTAETIKYAVAINDNVSTMAKGEHLTIMGGITALHGLRNEFADYLKFTPAQREKAEKSFRAALDEATGKSYDDAALARGQLAMDLTNDTMRKEYGQRLKIVQSKIATGGYDGYPVPRDAAIALLDAAAKNISEMQLWSNLMIAAKSTEGDWNEDMRQRIKLVDDLSEVAGEYRKMDQAAKEMGRTVIVDGDSYTMDQLITSEMEDIVDRFSKRRNNYHDKIFQKDRFPMANSFAKLASGSFGAVIPVDSHVGGIYTIDDKISVAALTTPVDKTFELVDGIAEVLPLGYDLFKMGEDVPYALTPDRIKAPLSTFLTKVMKAWLGFDDADWRVGDENPWLRLFIRGIVALPKYGMLIHGLTRGGHHGHGGADNSSSPGKATAQGGETTGIGAGPGK